MEFKNCPTKNLGIIHVFAIDGDRVYYWDFKWTPCVISRRRFEQEIN